jgi:cobalt-zinc-cadmium efflux system membrane fusion protein
VSAEENTAVVIPETAVQNLQGESTVFVGTSEGFKPVEVRLGRSDGEHVEILEGLESGQHYVTEGAFELKAKMVTSSMGAHAGHGH